MPVAEIIIANPPKGSHVKKKSKSRKAPSAKQKANWARFAAMARKRAKKVHRNPPSSSSSSKGRSVSKKAKIKRGVARAGRSIVADFTNKDLLMGAGAALGGFIAAAKAPDLPVVSKYMTKADGTPNHLLRGVAKVGIGVGLYMLLKQFRMGRLGAAVFTGAVVNASYGVLSRKFPQMVPSSLSGSEEDFAGYLRNVQAQLPAGGGAASMNGYARSRLVG
jgi:hypothetical protein